MINILLPIVNITQLDLLFPRVFFFEIEFNVGIEVSIFFFWYLAF